MRENRDHSFILLCFLYCLSAVFINTFGQVSPDMMQILHSTRDTQSLILTWQAIGGLFCSIFLSVFGESLPKYLTLIVAALLMSLGCFGASFFSGQSDPYAFIFFFLMVANIGYTAIDLTMNSYVTETYSDDKSTRLPVIHTFYGIGAILTPLVYLILKRIFAAKSYISMYLLLGICGTLLILGLFSRNRDRGNGIVRSSTSRSDLLQLFGSSRFWLLLLAAVLYTVFQCGISAWLPDCNLSARSFSPDASGLLVVSFFSGALIMRILSTRILREISLSTYYCVCGILSGVSLLLGVLSSSDLIYAILVALAGFFQGGMVPTFMIIASDAFPERPSSSSSIFITAVCIANLIAPYFSRIIETRSHMTLLSLIAVSLILSAIIIKLMYRRGKTQ